MSITAPNLPFGAQLIGRTEKSLGVLLDGIIAGTGLTEPEYVALRVCADHAGEPRATVITQLTAAFRRGDTHAAGLVDRLGSAGLIDSDHPALIELTPAGNELHDRLVRETNALTERLWGDLPSDDLAVTARVLNAVLGRAAGERVG